MRVCSGAGCLRAVQDDVRFCDECKQAVQSSSGDGERVHTSTDRERYAAQYSGLRWRQIRERALRRSPMCQRCERAATVIVDHIVPAGIAIAQARESGKYPTDRYAGFYLLSNLQGLCRACHWAKTIEDKAHTGPWDDVIAREAATPKRRYAF